MVRRWRSFRKSHKFITDSVMSTSCRNCRNWIHLLRLRSPAAFHTNVCQIERLNRMHSHTSSRTGTLSNCKIIMNVENDSKWFNAIECWWHSRQWIKVFVEYVILEFLCFPEYRTAFVENAHAHIFRAVQFRNVMHHMLMTGQFLRAQLKNWIAFNDRT